MKNINIHNYEEFAIDYMSGNLSAQDKKDFTTFLSEHPDIADELQLFQDIATATPAPTPSFKGLKKDINELDISDVNFEEYCIEYIEGELDHKGKAKLTQYIGQDKDRANTLALYQKTILQDVAMIYPHKDKLTKTVRKTLIPRRFIAISSALVAASIIAFLMLLVEPMQTLDDSTQALATVVETKKAPDTPATKEATEKINNTEATKTKQIEPEQLLAKAEIKRAKPKVKPMVREIKSKTEHAKLSTLKIKRSSINNNAIKIKHMPLATAESRVPLHTSETNVASNELRKKASNYLYTKVLVKSVESINKMAETDLGYEVIRDEDGNATRVILRSQFGDIDRTLAQR